MKNKSTRIVSAVLAASMAMSIVPAPAFAAGATTGGQIPYNVMASRMIDQQNSDPDSDVITIKMNEYGQPADEPVEGVWKFFYGTLYLENGTFTLDGDAYCDVYVAEGADSNNASLINSTIRNHSLTIQSNGTAENVNVSVDEAFSNVCYVRNRGTIESGIFDAEVTNDSTGVINGGTFNSKTTNKSGGTINNGTFNTLNNSGTVNSFFAANGANDVSDCAVISLDQNGGYILNGIQSLYPVVYLKTDPEHPRTVTISAPGGIYKITSWTLKVGDELKTLSAGEDIDLSSQDGPLGSIGVESAAVSKDGYSLTLEVTDSSALGSQLKVSSVIELLPAVSADDYIVAFGDEVDEDGKADNVLKAGSSQGRAWEYDPDCHYGITVKNKAGDTLTEGYTASLTRDKADVALSDFDGKPGNYVLTITFPGTDSNLKTTLTYEFQILKRYIRGSDLEAMDVVEVTLPGENGTVIYDGEKHPATVTKKSGYPDKMGDPAIEYYKLGEDGMPTSWVGTTEAPKDNGMYAVVVNAEETEYYSDSSFFYGLNEAGDAIEKYISIVPKELTSDDFTYDDETGEITSPTTEGLSIETVYESEDGTKYTMDSATGYLYDSNGSFAPAGEYKVYAKVGGDYNGAMIQIEDAAKTVEKYPVVMQNIAISSYEYDGTTHAPVGSWFTAYDREDEEPDFIVTFYDYETDEEVESPTAAGTYYFVVTSTETDNLASSTYGSKENKDLTKFEITKRETPVTADEIHFDTSALDELAAKLSVEDAAEALRNAITTDHGIDKDDLEFTFYDENGDLVKDAIRKEGNYTFKITVRDSDNYVGTPEGEYLENGDWQFKVIVNPQPVDFVYPAESDTIPGDIADRFVWTATDETETDEEQKELDKDAINPGTRVTLSWESVNHDTEYTITGLTAVYTENDEEKSIELEKNEDGTYTFEMPNAPVTLQVSVNGSLPVGPLDPDSGDPINPEPDFPG